MKTGIHKTIFILLIICGYISISNAQEEITIEPPFWWTGMNNSKLQLLIHGKDISESTPRIEATEFTIDSVIRLEGKNYLALNLDISEKCTPGIYTLIFEQNGKAVELEYELKPRAKDSKNRRGFDNKDVLYLITPDRFANGDTSNDEVKGMREGLNRKEEFGRHGGDIRGIIDHLDYIKKMGFSAIWLNPVLENDMEGWSYHGYATTDYYKVDPRFGSNEEYLELSERAGEMGIGIIMDIIVNHCGSFHPWLSDPPSSDWFNYQGEKYQETNHRKETLLDPYASAVDRKIMTNGWFVTAMPDLNQRNPIVSKYLIQNSIWWIEYANLYGIRQDTYSYPFREFMTDWTCAIMEEYPNFNIVGEEWIDDPAIVSYWQRYKINVDGYTSCLPSMMDFPLCFSLHKSLTEEEGWGTGLIKLYQCLSRDFHYSAPNDLVIFPDNHDMSRIYTQLNEDYNLFKMAMVYTLTTRGVPQLYYGTEILMSHMGTDSHGAIRSDFPGGWEGDSISVFSNQFPSAKSKEAKDFVSRLINWRKDKDVIHFGSMTHYVPQDGVYVYFRHDEEKKIMIVLNKNKEASNLELNRFSELIEDAKLAYDPMKDISHDLNLDLKIAPMSAIILEIR